MKLVCKDCNKSLEDCTCIKSTIDFPKQRLEKYSERFDNDESAIGNPETWGKRVLTEEDIFNQRDIDAVTDYIGKETSKQETLEEAAENHAKIFQFPFDCDPAETFIEGAKWQQEQDRNVYLNGYVDGSREQAKLMYNQEDLECAWSSSEQNMRFQFSSSAYKGITFKQWLENFKEE
jgi:hypothetical protein